MPPSEMPPTWPNLTVTGFSVAAAVALAAGALDAVAVGGPPPHAPATNRIAKAAASLGIARVLGRGRGGGERRGVLAPARAARGPGGRGIHGAREGVRIAEKVALVDPHRLRVRGLERADRGRPALGLIRGERLVDGGVVAVERGHEKLGEPRRAGDGEAHPRRAGGIRRVRRVARKGASRDPEPLREKAHDAIEPRARLRDTEPREIGKATHDVIAERGVGSERRPHPAADGEERARLAARPCEDADDPLAVEMPVHGSRWSDLALGLEVEEIRGVLVLLLRDPELAPHARARAVAANDHTRAELARVPAFAHTHAHHPPAFAQQPGHDGALDGHAGPALGARGEHRLDPFVRDRDRPTGRRLVAYGGRVPRDDPAVPRAHHELAQRDRSVGPQRVKDTPAIEDAQRRRMEEIAARAVPLAVEALDEERRDAAAPEGVRERRPRHGAADDDRLRRRRGGAPPARSARRRRARAASRARSRATGTSCRSRARARAAPAARAAAPRGRAPPRSPPSRRAGPRGR